MPGPKGAKKKGLKKKQQDAFLKKEWYVAKVPTYFDTPITPSIEKGTPSHRIGYTPAKKGGAKKALDNRTFLVSLGDLQKDPKSEYKPEYNAKKFKFMTEEVFGQQLLTTWYGMEITRDHRCSLIRKWYSMIQATVDCKTTDNYVLRIQALAFTKRQITQVKKNCYCKNSQARAIRARMRDIIKNAVSTSDLKSVITKLSEGTIGHEIRKSCQLTFPLKVCLIEKVRVLRRPKKDVARLMQIHDLERTFDQPMAGEENDEEDDNDNDDDDNDDESEEEVE